MRHLAVVFVCTVLASSIGWSQFQFGSVSGLVKDSSQAPVPSAFVEARSKTTNVARRTTTDTSGQFAFISLPPDTYTITVRHPGFSNQSRTVQLSVDQRVAVDFTLELGAVYEQVTVEGSVAAARDRDPRNWAIFVRKSRWPTFR